MEKVKKSGYVKKLKLALSIFSLFFVMFGIVGPLEIYNGNIKEFEFGFADFFWMFLVIYGIIWFIGSAVLALFPEKVVNVVIVPAFAISVCCYVQNMFLNKSLTTLDGGHIRWDSIKSTITVNTIVWAVMIILIVALAFILKDKWIKIACYVTYFICIIQLVAAVSIIITVPKSRHYAEELRIDATDQFKVAPNDNIIVLVCDRFANSGFDEMLEEKPANYETFKDFTYYNNDNSVFMGTARCMNLLLTGEVPDDTKPDWDITCWKPEKVQRFYDILHEHGYTCYLASRDTTNVYGDMVNMTNKYDNIKVLDTTFDAGLLFRLLTKMTIFKYAPYIVKEPFEVMTYSFTDVIASETYKESLHMLPEFYKGLMEEGFSVDENLDNLFKIQHIQGLHQGYIFTGDCQEVADTEGTYEGMRQGLNVILEEYLKSLKACGIYDSATIIITSDHGDGMGELSLQPTMLIKRPYEEHDTLQINSAPISHYDFVPTVLYWLGEDYKGYASGTTFYDWNEGDVRPRSATIDGVKYDYTGDRDDLWEEAKHHWDNSKN